MAIVGKETIDDVEVDEEGNLNPDPSDAMKPAVDENGEAKPAEADAAKAPTPTAAAEGEKKEESQEDSEEKSETPRPPRTVSILYTLLDRLSLFKIFTSLFFICFINSERLSRTLSEPTCTCIAAPILPTLAASSASTSYEIHRVQCQYQSVRTMPAAISQSTLTLVSSTHIRCTH